jgi:DNA (cytosine-5)-methyltransferase 1
MNYLSVCSGIEAATVAWHHMGWKPVGFSEIEKFPSQVLAHHYPQVTNFGDMTKYKEWKLNDSIGLLVGGTPCQSFSVAGLRKGLDDPRGNLAITYVGILDKFRPKWCVWENVPGVLSSNGGRDFGAFLGALVELGYGFAYRVLDAQHFGVPQRRRRVFVVGCLGSWESAAKVLFESESLSGDIKKGRSKKQETAAFTPSSFGQYSEGVGTLRSAGGDLGGGSETLYVSKTGKCLKTRIRNDYETKNFVVFEPRSLDETPRIHDNICPTLNTIQGGQRQPCVALAENTIGRQPLNGGNGVGFTENGPMYTLNATGVHGIAQFVDVYNQAVDGQVSATMTNACGGTNTSGPKIMQNMAVRKLTPVECERLQGFPDNYTNIKENCPDGPRYKALGNSMAVPVMKWIGERINLINKAQEK